VNLHNQLGKAQSTAQIDNYAKELTDMLFDSSIKFLKLAKLRRKLKKPKKKTWFNLDCVNLKKRLKNLAKLFEANPKDPYIRGQLSNVKNEYKKNNEIK